MNPIIRSSAASLLAVFATMGTAVADPLPGSEWAPVELAGEAFESVSEKDVFLQFQQDGRYFGTGGCNTFRGSFVTNDNAILFGPGAATMMACPDPIMQQELSFLKVLMSARMFERDGTSLVLSDKDGAIVLRMQQRDAD